MFARLVSCQGRKDKINEAMRIWKNMDTPELKSEKSYRGGYLLVDRSTGKAISMTLWDSEEDAISEEQKGLYLKQVDRYKDILVGPIVREGYEVIAQD